MLPKSKIEIYNASNTLIYTINNGAESIHTHEVLNGVGNFSFTLPVKLFKPKYGYNDIIEGWKAKIYFNGYSTPVSADLITTGKLNKIAGPLDLGNGYTRVCDGKNLGAVLEQRQKTNKRYIATQADDIAAEIASDLGLSTDFDVDTTAENITVRTLSYSDLLAQVSDYWYDAGTQVKKDFYVNPTGALVWKARPIRTTGVTPLTTTKKENYSVVRDTQTIKNHITVYGAATAPFPNLKDDFTDALSGTYNGHAWSWTATTGTLTLEAGLIGAKAGSYRINCASAGASNICDFTLTLPYSINVRDINKLNFWYSADVLANQGHLRILAPDTSNYFETPVASAIWAWFNGSIGESAEYDVDENPSGIWTKTGTPNWWDIRGLRFITNADMGSTHTVYVDKLYFSPDRWSAVATDSTSITNYGQCDAEYTADDLLSNLECTIRAETLKYQLKDPIIRVDIFTRGNTNIKIGDRIPLTLPVENITATNFDVVSVDHNLTLEGFKTKASMVNSGSTRYLPSMPGANFEVINHQIGNLKQVTSDLYSRVVR
jgi:hypothetical protein